VFYERTQRKNHEKDIEKTPPSEVDELDIFA
jgi:hypothetical protein